MKEIKNCPCCGGKSLIGEDTSGDYMQNWTWWIECTVCSLFIERQYDIDVIKAWNLRVDTNE